MTRPRFLPIFYLAAVLPLAAPGCTRIEMLNATVPAWGYDRSSNISYGDDPRQFLDVYRPPGNPADDAKDRPVVVFIYGGYWQWGSKVDYRFVGQALASKGFVAVLPDYRLYPEVTFPAFVEDAAAAVRWTRDNIKALGGDPDRIYLMGHSAGAHTVALLALDEHYLSDAGVPRGAIRAAAALSGPYDFLPGPDTYRVFRMSPEDKAAPSETQPIRFARRGAPPLILLHGGKDDVCYPDNATKLADAIRAAGGESRAVIYENLGHAGVAQALAWSFRWRAPVLRDAVEFFRAEE